MLQKQLGVIDSLLEQLIDRQLIDQEAARLQLDVSDGTGCGRTGHRVRGMQGLS
jgi:hypothetical protein